MIRRALCFVFGHEIGWVVLGRSHRAGCTRCGTTMRTGTWDEIKRCYGSERSLWQRGPFP